MELWKAKEAITKVTTYVRLHECPKDVIQMYQATGFFYKYADRSFLVTNEHVLHGMSEIKVFTRSKEREITLPLWFPDGKKLWDCLGNQIDVAVLKIPEDRLKNIYWVPAFTEDDMKLSDDERVSTGTQVLVLGYPLDFYDRVSRLPITRGATISTDVWRDFQRKPRFLIDAKLQEGMSGSPVIYTKNPTWDAEVKLLGVFSSSWFKGEPLELHNVWHAGIIKRVVEKLHS
jgi:S1-C subfamily serine protease